MTTGLGARQVKAIAAAKHHTVAATEGGEVFTWGSNRGNSTTIFLVHYINSSNLFLSQALDS